MNDTVKYSLISLAIIGLAVGAYFIFNKKEEKPKPSIEVGDLSQFKYNPDGTIEEFNPATKKWELVV